MGEAVPEVLVLAQESPIAIPSLADKPGWLHSLQPSSKAPQ